MVDGLPAAGKATLKGLLDGHTQIFTGYNHDMIADAICDTDCTEWLKYKDVLYLRSLLATTHYYQLEYFSHKKSTVIVMKADQNNRFKIELDFYDMDRTFMENLLEMKEWSYESIVTSIFQSMMNAGPYPENKDAIKHYVSMGYNRNGICEKFMEAYNNGKILYMLRPIEQVIATLTKRTPASDDMWSMVLLETTVKKLVEHGFVKRLKESEIYMHKMARLYPDRVKLISFENLIQNTDTVMYDIAEWLGIPYEEALKKCSVAGNEMFTDEGKKFTGAILDKVENLLNEKERAIIALEISLSNFLIDKRYRYFAPLFFVIFSRLKRKLRKSLDSFLSLLSVSYRNACQSQWQRNGFW